MMPLTTKQKTVVYWIGTGLFTFMFLFSAIWSLVDIPGTIKETRALGYPAFTVIPLALAKLLGLAAILTNKSRTLKEFAFAGFLFDLILAVLGHYYHPEVGTGIGLAVFGMVLWVYTFLADRFLRTPQPARNAPAIDAVSPA